jgi:hypothetical protein
MAKFRRLRITALPMRIARAVPLFRRRGPCSPLKNVQGKSSHSSLTYLPAVYAIAALGGRGEPLNTKAGGLWQRAVVDPV